ncbi:hypothetical protein H107_05447 [Trichophyton rubrum CBS 202.88]|uniref:Uncharacterized protein n=1 Tax=Trichophyton rubrum (strain ATCC MYA-4607 / CBS 118892) TaxID=559305 RepID=A0A080WLP6_TRIRC|nr:uncharacterized protein TERG_11939 [Trichophyton rubrum CBS 118892]EZG15588.1 hypothetical protein H107_05447 [Trichophyton rubrum CBS 202.88]EZG15589.1 hypothetical protein H107_05447 [Trichophyton rubrum CBS 202.88]KFL61055.1 hypothetical protein TERG_11939 [Trichophyton rubrum CBS 118892]
MSLSDLSALRSQSRSFVASSNTTNSAMLQQARHILRYLAGQPEATLTLGKRPERRLEAFVDAGDEATVNSWSPTSSSTLAVQSNSGILVQSN